MGLLLVDEMELDKQRQEGSQRRDGGIKTRWKDGNRVNRGK